MQVTDDTRAHIVDDRRVIAERDASHGRIDSSPVIGDFGVADPEKTGLDGNSRTAVIVLYAAIVEKDGTSATDLDAFLVVIGNVDVDQSHPAHGCNDADPLTGDRHVADSDIRAPVDESAVKNGYGPIFYGLAVDGYAMPRERHAPVACAGNVDRQRLTPVAIGSNGVDQRIACVAIDIDRWVLRHRTSGPQPKDQAEKQRG